MVDLGNLWNIQENEFVFLLQDPLPWMTEHQSNDMPNRENAYSIVNLLQLILISFKHQCILFLFDTRMCGTKNLSLS